MLIEVVGPPIRHERVLHHAGDRLEVPDTVAAQFLAVGRAKRVAVEVPPAAARKKAAPPTSNTSKPPTTEDW